MAGYNKMSLFALALVATLFVASVTAHHPPGSACYLPADKGTCDKNLKRYFHNHDDDKCEVFTYGGCGGNGNNFETWEKCQEECGHEQNHKH